MATGGQVGIVNRQVFASRVRLRAVIARLRYGLRLILWCLDIITYNNNEFMISAPRSIPSCIISDRLTGGNVIHFS